MIETATILKQRDAAEPRAARRGRARPLRPSMASRSPGRSWKLCTIGGHGAKVLFATHFHELTRLAGASARSVIFTSPSAMNDEIVFLHKVQPGGTDRSYGIQVARLAGLPRAVIARSKALLAELEEAGQLRTDGAMPSSSASSSPPAPDPLLAELASLDSLTSRRSRP